jgi:hypothetical protein
MPQIALRVLWHSQSGVRSTAEIAAYLAKSISSTIYLVEHFSLPAASAGILLHRSKILDILLRKNISWEGLFYYKRETRFLILKVV